MTETEDRRGRTPGFKGRRNNDTTAATAASIAVRTRKARERARERAIALLQEDGYTVVAPAVDR